MMKTKITFPLVILTLILVQSACAGTGDLVEDQISPSLQVPPVLEEDQPNLISPEDSLEIEPVIPDQDNPGDEIPLIEIPVIRIAREDLAIKLGVAAEDITVIRIESVTWSDGSLGCPRSGAMYPQVLTPGYYLVFTVNGENFTYHTDMDTRVVQCADPREGRKTLAGSLDLDLTPLVNQARNDLVDRLGIDQAVVEVVLSEPVVWPDASLGCPQPGMKYRRVRQDGARIVLRVGSELYTYHSGSDQALVLCEQPPPLFKKTPGPKDEFIPPPEFDD